MGVAASPVKADVLAIQGLPSYINSNTFKISCTANAGSAQFAYSKHGGAFTNFGPTINTGTDTCVVQVDGNIITDQTDYTFRVSDGNGNAFTTSTTYDTSGTGAPSGFYKDGLSDGYRLHWRNPSDSDFSRVIIYRGDTPDFSADGNHEIATVLGSPNSDMTYEDHSGTNKYYDIRALDIAGNSSSLVGDGGGIVTVTATPSPVTRTGQAIILPKEQPAGQGSVLGTELTPSPSPAQTPNIIQSINSFANTTPNPLRWILTHKKISIGVLLVIIAIGLAVYSFGKRKREI